MLSRENSIFHLYSCFWHLSNCFWHLSICFWLPVAKMPGLLNSTRRHYLRSNFRFAVMEWGYMSQTAKIWSRIFKVLIFYPTSILLVYQHINIAVIILCLHNNNNLNKKLDDFIHYFNSNRFSLLKIRLIINSVW